MDLLIVWISRATPGIRASLDPSEGKSSAELLTVCDSGRIAVVRALTGSNREEQAGRTCRARALRGLAVLPSAQGEGGALSAKGAEGFFGYSLTCRETAATNSSTRHHQLSEYVPL